MDKFYDALMDIVRELKKEVPDDTMLDLLMLRQTDEGKFEVPKYDPLWEIVKRVGMVLPLVKLANEFKPDPDFQALIDAGELFFAVEPPVAFDAPEECFVDDDAGEHPSDTVPALPFEAENDREETRQQEE